MQLFHKKKKNVEMSSEGFDREIMEPVIRASICNGEQVAGFKEKATGKFHEAAFIRSDEDLDTFCRQYGVEKSKIRKEY